MSLSTNPGQRAAFTLLLAFQAINKILSIIFSIYIIFKTNLYLLNKPQRYYILSNGLLVNILTLILNHAGNFCQTVRYS